MAGQIGEAVHLREHSRRFEPAPCQFTTHAPYTGTTGTYELMPYEGNKDGRHYWLTPPALMESLQLEFGFDYDPCPFPRPDDYDGLTAEWGQSNYVNPPFKGPTAWVRKSIEESKKGKRVVFVFPVDKWVLMLLDAGAKVRNLRDVKWCATEDGLPGKGIGRHIAMFVLEPQDPSATE